MDDNITHAMLDPLDSTSLARCYGCGGVYSLYPDDPANVSLETAWGFKYLDLEECECEIPVRRYPSFAYLDNH